MKRAKSKELTAEQEAQLARLSELPDDQINTKDIPEQTDWTGARRGVFYRPVKKQLTLRLDADLIDWFKTRTANGEGYQTSINNALREYVSQRSHR
jgi:uncharacterized protein (DUF4415 family)